MAIPDLSIVSPWIPFMSGLEIFVPGKLVELARARAEQIEFVRNYPVRGGDNLVEIFGEKLADGVSIEIRIAVEKESWLIAVPDFVECINVQFLDHPVRVIFFGGPKILVI